MVLSYLKIELTVYASLTYCKCKLLRNRTCTFLRSQVKNRLPNFMWGYLRQCFWSLRDKWKLAHFHRWDKTYSVKGPWHIFNLIPSDGMLIFHTPCDWTISSFVSFLLTSVLMARGLLPSLPRKCSGDSMAPSWRKSASLSWSVSVVAEMPASGPRLGREPAAIEGSGICPGIMSDQAATAPAMRQREGRWDFSQK